MRRSLVTLVAFTALAAWAGAQGPPPAQVLTAADQVKLFKTNRVLIENLVSHGVDLAEADDPIRRAEECRKTARSLANALRMAADAEDPSRVVELADLMGEVVRDGLTPNLDAARASLQPGDPREKQLRGVLDNATIDLDFAGAIPAGKAAENPKVRDALAGLKDLRMKLGK